MRLLVDECVQGPVRAALVEAGFDLVFVSVDFASVDDTTVAQIAIDQERILLTEDFDFGELAVRERLPLPGLVIINCRVMRPEERPARVLEALAVGEAALRDVLTLVEPRRIRRRRLR